ncbi:hypothetical protein B0J11DRAFT_440589 [Dendryphion nanum]|uniref:Transcriptional regulator n=1 Tax=Dendryphion nanum TaxID=256645 RepID=A0A9P9DHR8_9PLEO|nr:hypothetical protein B0J11DRAFT_440589 [Dendryphion nanum]
MSDQEAVDLPSDTAIARALHDVVLAIHKTGKEDELTIKRVRTQAEKELSLPTGFLKTNDKWKQKSNQIIKDAVPAKAKTAPRPKKVTPAKPKADTAKGVKRKAAAPAKRVVKRKKTTISDDESEQDILSDADSEPPKRTPATRPTKKAKGDVSESELSSLIDDEPPKRGRQKAPQGKGAKKKDTKATKTAKPKAKAASNDDPDTAEIKRLQSWLVKCGIRKVWSKELAQCDTSKERIKHLKGMLSDAGMDGRFSDEKAAKIKEEREFAKDLEAIQVGNEAWGQSADTGGRPRRRAAQAAKPIILKQPKFSDESEEDDNESDGGDDDDSEHPADSVNEQSDGGSASESEPSAGGDSD